MIPDDLRLALVENLLCVPFVAEGGRDALLSGMPNLFLYRNEEGNAFGDMVLLVAQLSEIFGANGEWRLLQLVDNALPSVGGTEVGWQLRKIRGELVEVQKGLRPVQVHPAEIAQPRLSVVGDEARLAGHAFISYIREDAHHVERLQRVLETAGIPVWRDTLDLWPGEDWRAKIRQAITDDALVFIACFSECSVARAKSHQNEELILAIEQLRSRRPEDPWLIPVRFSDCEIPDRDIGAGRTLRWLQRADLFGERADEGAARLVATILRLLRRSEGSLTEAPQA